MAFSFHQRVLIFRSRRVLSLAFGSLALATESRCIPRNLQQALFFFSTSDSRKFSFVCFSVPFFQIQLAFFFTPIYHHHFLMMRCDALPFASSRFSRSISRDNSLHFSNCLFSLLLSSSSFVGRFLHASTRVCTASAHWPVDASRSERRRRLLLFETRRKRSP